MDFVINKKLIVIGSGLLMFLLLNEPSKLSPLVILTGVIYCFVDSCKAKSLEKGLKYICIAMVLFFVVGSVVLVFMLLYERIQAEGFGRFWLDS
jgi:uncharacterized membrane protein YdcZ (DUF606 family)